MSWDSVPWLVGGGAEHSPETARLLAYAAFGGKEGIVSPGDLKVLPLAVPGGSVRVSPGAGSATAKASGGAQQSYVFRNPTDDVVDIAATGSASGRSDLIVARVEDPFMPGEPWAAPSNVKVGPYIFTRVIPNVASTQTTMPFGYTGVVLARIDIPANTGTITSGMIKDLRKLARPRTERSLITFQPTVTEALTAGSFAKWPNFTATVPVPAWATHAVIRGEVSSAYGSAVGTAVGALRVRLGTAFTQQSVFSHVTNFAGQRFGTPVADTVAIPLAMRGTDQAAEIQGVKVSGTSWTVDSSSFSIIDIEFQERTV